MCFRTCAVGLGGTRVMEACKGATLTGREARPRAPVVKTAVEESRGPAQLWVGAACVRGALGKDVQVPSPGDCTLAEKGTGGTGIEVGEVWGAFNPLGERRHYALSPDRGRRECGYQAPICFPAFSTDYSQPPNLSDRHGTTRRPRAPKPYPRARPISSRASSVRQRPLLLAR